MLLNCGVGEDSWESLGLKGDPTSPSYMRSVLGVHQKDWCWSWNSNTLATSCEELTHLKRPWCWERLRAGGEGDGRGRDGWMASLTPSMHMGLGGFRELVMDREVCHAVVHGVTKSRMWLSDWTQLNCPVISTWRIPFSISKAGFLATNFLILFTCNILILPLFLTNSFFVVVVVYSLNSVLWVYHPLMTSWFSWFLVSPLSLSLRSPCVCWVCFLSLLLLQGSLLVFWQFGYDVSRYGFPFVYSTSSVSGFLDAQVNVHKIWGVFSYSFFKYYFCPFWLSLFLLELSHRSIYQASKFLVVFL